MLIKYISIIIGSILEVYSVTIYVSSFSKKKDIKKLYLVLFFIIISFYQILVSVFFQGTILLACSIIMTLIVNQLYKSKIYIKLILSLTYIILGVASEMLVSGLLMLTNSTNFSTLNSEPNLYSLGVILSKFITFLIIIIIKLCKRQLVISSLSYKYLFVLSILPLTTIVMIVLMYQIMWIIDDTQLKMTFVFASIMLIISNIVTFEVIRKQNRLSYSEFELKLLKNNISKQTQHYSNLKFSHEETRRLRHDLRNTCIGAVAELKAGKIDNAIEQLQKHIDTIEKTYRVIDTGHPAIDAILESNISKCENLNINVLLSYNFKSNININEIEIAVIIGNILDNAVDACQLVSNDDKKISISIIVEEHNIIINIQNSATGSNNYKTNKKNKELHGYGLTSVSHIAKMHKGYAKFNYNNNTFSSYVILEN